MRQDLQCIDCISHPSCGLDFCIGDSPTIDHLCKPLVMAVGTICTYIVVRTVVRPVPTHSLYLVGFVSCFIVLIPLGLVFVCSSVEKEARVLPWALSFANTNKKK